MNFVFERKRHSGGKRGKNDEPDYPAVRVTSYVDKTKGGGTKRLRFSFSMHTVSFARWIAGDRLQCGADPDNMQLAFKRCPEGYKLVGKPFGAAKDRPSIQVTVDDDSPVALITAMCLNRWLRLHESGVLLVTESLSGG